MTLLSFFNSRTSRAEKTSKSSRKLGSDFMVVDISEIERLSVIEHEEQIAKIGEHTKYLINENNYTKYKEEEFKKEELLAIAAANLELDDTRKEQMISAYKAVNDVFDKDEEFLKITQLMCMHKVLC